MSFAQLLRITVALFFLAFFYSFIPKEPLSGEEREVVNILSAYPNGSCLQAKLKNDPLPYRIGILNKTHDGKMIVTMSGITPATTENIISVEQVIEPVTNDEWQNCLKQFALNE